MSNNEIKGHRDLEVWREGIALVEGVYNLTKNFPDDEKFGLTSQLKRAAISVPSNIAEGAARNSDKEFLQFLYIAQGSIVEIETHLIIAEKLRFISAKQNIEAEQQRNKVARLLFGLIRSIRAKL